jgi:hypothetical protein
LAVRACRLKSAGRSLCHFKLLRPVLVQHAEENHDGFLPLGEDGLEVLLGDGQILLGFGASLTEGLELGLNGVGRCALIVEGCAQVSERILNGRRLSGSRAAESTATGAATAWAATARAAAAAAEHSAAAGIGVALEAHDGFDFGLDGREFIIAGAKLLLEEIHPGLWIESTAAAESASPAATSLATIVLGATVLPATVLAATVLAAVILILAEDWHSQQANHQRRH